MDAAAILVYGAAVLMDGASVLMDGASVLMDGAAVLMDGAAVLVDGASVLMDGAAVLVDGRRKQLNGAAVLPARPPGQAIAACFYAAHRAHPLGGRFYRAGENAESLIVAADRLLAREDDSADEPSSPQQRRAARIATAQVNLHARPGGCG